MVVPTEGRVHTVASTIPAAAVRLDLIASPYHNARDADANWFRSRIQGALESALLDRERRGVQP
jgi:hypothetical protein